MEIFDKIIRTYIQYQEQKKYFFFNFYPLMNEIKLNEMFLTVQLVGKCAVESD